MDLIDWEGKELIPFIYSHLAYITNDLLKVRQDDKFGLIKPNRQVVLPIIYDNLDIWSNEQLILTKLDEKMGLMTFNHKVLFPNEYDEINLSDNKIVLVKGKKCAYYFPGSANTTAFKYLHHFSQVHQSKFHQIAININPSRDKGFRSTDLRQGILDSVGTEIIPTIYGQLDMSNIHNGVVIAQSIEKRKFGLLSAKNDTLLPFRFKTLIFSEDDIIVAHEQSPERKSTFYDFKAHQLFGTHFEQARQFSEGLAAVSQNGKWGFINSKGDYIVSLKYYLVRPFNNGVAMVFIDKDQWGYIDKNGKEYFEN